MVNLLTDENAYYSKQITELQDTLKTKEDELRNANHSINKLRQQFQDMQSTKKESNHVDVRSYEEKIHNLHQTIEYLEVQLESKQSNSPHKPQPSSQPPSVPKDLNERSNDDAIRRLSRHNQVLQMQVQSLQRENKRILNESLMDQKIKSLETIVRRNVEEIDETKNQLKEENTRRLAAEEALYHQRETAKDYTRTLSNQAIGADEEKNRLVDIMCRSQDDLLKAQKEAFEIERRAVRGVSALRSKIRKLEGLLEEHLGVDPLMYGILTSDDEESIEKKKKSAKYSGMTSTETIDTKNA